MIPALAHAGAGASWQAAVVVASVVLAGCVVLAALGRIPMGTPGDLLVPIAGAAIIGSVGPVGAEWLSDAIGWGVPLGIVSLLALALAALTPLSLAPGSPLTLGALALAAVSMVLLHGPLSVALHPPPEEIPLADDSAVSILAPDDGEAVDAGAVGVTVEVTGGSIGPGLTPLEELGEDPEEAGSLHVFVDGERREVSWSSSCTVPSPCSTVDFEVQVPPGEQELTVEFVRGDGSPFAPLVLDRITVVAE